MPLPIGPCEVPSTSCCDGVYEDGVSILNVAMAGLASCFAGECLSPPLTAFVSWGVPAVGRHLDMLVAQFVSATPEPEAQNFMNLHRVRWSLLLAETGYPTAEGAPGSIRDVDIAELHAVNRHVFGHAMSLLKVLSAAQADGTLLPACQKIRLSGVTPAVGGGLVLGGMAGAQIDVTYLRAL